MVASLDLHCGPSVRSPGRPLQFPSGALPPGRAGATWKCALGTPRNYSGRSPQERRERFVPLLPYMEGILSETRKSAKVLETLVTRNCSRQLMKESKKNVVSDGQRG